jgi:flavin reductase (DIM6/NTAB) family NADH-FMN oxidoreductase RutF
MKRLLKLKNYDVHSITSVHGGRTNGNIATWVMQSAMQGKYLTVALDREDFTIGLVKQSGWLNVNLLAEEQARHVPVLGRKSGRDRDKLKTIPHGLDARGCPYLLEAVGYVQGEVEDSVVSGDHELFVVRVISQKVLNSNRVVLTNRYLVEKGWVRA